MHATNRMLLVCTITTLILLPMAALEGAIVAEYDFTDSSRASVDTEPNSTADDFTSGIGINLFIKTNVGNPAPADAIEIGNGGDLGGTDPGGDETFAINNDDYYSFTITPESGLSINLDSLTFDFHHTANGIDRPSGADAFSLYSSADGFAASLGTATMGGADSWHSRSITLSDDASVQQLTAATELRLYVWQSGKVTSSDHDLSIDNIVLHGEVVPEPASITCLGLVGLMALRRRRQ